MANTDFGSKLPFEFGRGTFIPFQSGENSRSFVAKSVVFYAIVSTILFVLFGGMIIEPYMEIIKLSMESETGDVSDAQVFSLMMSVMGRLFLGMIFLGMGMWVAWAMIESALHRRVLFGENKTGLFPWRLGADEGRVMVCQLVNYLAYQALYMVVYFLMLLGIGLTVLMGSQSMAFGVIGGLITGGLTIAGLGIMVWVLIRLAPAAALSVAKKDIAIGEVWPVAKGRVGAAFGSYVFHYVLSTIVMYMIIGVLILAFVGSSIGDFMALADLQEDQVWQGMKDIFNRPGVKVGLVLTGLVGGMLYGLWMMCTAGIATHLTELYLEEKNQNSAKVFT